VLTVPLEPWAAQFMPGHEGGPWLRLVRPDGSGGVSVLASMPVGRETAQELRVLAAAIEGAS
jgi:hypothetical protein